MKKNSHITRALNNLKKSPLKVTIQRTRLIEILFKNGDHHFTAEDVHKEVNKNKYNIYLKKRGSLLRFECSTCKVFFKLRSSIYFDNTL